MKALLRQLVANTVEIVKKKRKRSFGSVGNLLAFRDPFEPGPPRCGLLSLLVQ